MPRLSPPEIERRALALFEHLADQPDNKRLRARLTKNEPDKVIARLSALERSATLAMGAIPTLIPGSADCDDAAIPPARVGAFRLVERIGKGGMGDVWLGERSDGLYEQTVAIKLIQRHALHRAAAAFEDERRFLARLEHPNIARLIDGGVTEDGLPWLAMEFFEGEPIDVVCAALPLADRVQLFVKAADAVQFAHGRMVAHADLKPGNILVGAGNRVKLLDFGISGLIGGDAKSPAGSGPLTREFASPERIAGGPPSVADDVYALGKTLSLVRGDNDDDELQAIAQKASAPHEKDRYAGVGALIADLDRWSANLPVAAVGDRWLYRADKFVQRHRTGVMATGAAFVLLSATSLLATASYVRAERARAEASARFDDARGAARFVSVDLLGKLAAQPGTLALRTRTADVTQRYLDRLAASPSAPPGMRLEAAEGLLRLAEAQGRPGVPNLGEPEAARRNLERAYKLVTSVPGIEAKRLTVRVLLDQARLLSNSENEIDQALKHLREADALLSGDKSAPPFLLAQYGLERSVALQWKGDYSRAIRAAKYALSVLPKNQARDTLLLRASALDLLAEAGYYSGAPKAAISPYREALVVLEQAKARYATDQFVARQLARAQWALGTTLVDHGSKAEALNLVTASEAGLRTIAEADPGDADVRRMLRISENARAQALAANGRVGEGLKLFRSNTEARKAHWMARPGETLRMRDYMVAVKALGDMETGFGQVSEGCRSYEEAQQLIEKLRARARLTGLDLTDLVANLANRERKFCAGTGRNRKT